MAKYRNAGQTCVCTNRIYVHEAVHDSFIEKFAAKVAALTVGDGFADKVAQGPLIADAAIAKVQEHVQDALDTGAKVTVGGKDHELGRRLFHPPVLSNVRENMPSMHAATLGHLAPANKTSHE